jgi:hypothetical protein
MGTLSNVLEQEKSCGVEASDMALLAHSHKIFTAPTWTPQTAGALTCILTPARASKSGVGAPQC